MDTKLACPMARHGSGEVGGGMGMFSQARLLLLLNTDCCTLIMEVILRNKKDQLAILECGEDAMCSS